jgi:DNA-binding Lrp family transcriptional regulator
MDALLDELKRNGRESSEILAKKLRMTAKEVDEKIAQYEKSGIIRGFQAVLNTNLIECKDVHAVIELKIRPLRETGFASLAEKIARFPQVESCFLMSGGYDLLVFVKGKTLQDVAHFVAADLSTIDGVLSTATHFMLHTYKDQDVLMLSSSENDTRLAVVP